MSSSVCTKAVLGSLVPRISKIYPIPRRLEYITEDHMSSSVCTKSYLRQSCAKDLKDIPYTKKVRIYNGGLYEFKCLY